MTKAMLLEVIAEAKEQCDYEYIGVRTQEEAFALGEISHCSSVWVDEEETDDMLDGICCTSIDSPAIVAHCDEGVRSMYGKYYGGHSALIASNDADIGEDVGELILRDAVVVKIIK